MSHLSSHTFFLQSYDVFFQGRWHMVNLILSESQNTCRSTWVNPYHSCCFCEGAVLPRRSRNVWLASASCSFTMKMCKVELTELMSYKMLQILCQNQDCSGHLRGRQKIWKNTCVPCAMVKHTMYGLWSSTIIYHVGNPHNGLMTIHLYVNINHETWPLHMWIFAN